MSVRKQVKSFPKYQIHKASNRACVWWRSKRHYLGVANSPESIEAYNQFIAEIARSKGNFNPDLESSGDSSGSNQSITVGALMASYLPRIQPEVTPKEFDNIKYSFRPLRKLHEHTLVDKFGPKALKQVRQVMIDDGLTRKVINQRIGRIRRLFRFGVAEEMVSASTLHALQAVDGLREGRSAAPDNEPIKPVSDDQIKLLEPYLSNVVAAMLKIQRLTGARPGEVCRMRACDIDMSGDVWFYSPYKHKTQWKGKSRVIPIGPQAQDVLKPFLDRSAETYLFTPQESYTWYRENRTPDMAPRKTKIFPSELRRREKYRKIKKPVRRLRSHFTTGSYDRAVERAILRAQKFGVNIEYFAPNQARHARATEIRRDHGIEGAQVVLGHAKADVTQVYAERDLQKAAQIARESG